MKTNFTEILTTEIVSAILTVSRANKTRWEVSRTAYS